MVNAHVNVKNVAEGKALRTAPRERLDDYYGARQTLKNYRRQPHVSKNVQVPVKNTGVVKNMSDKFERASPFEGSSYNPTVELAAA